MANRWWEVTSGSVVKYLSDSRPSIFSVKLIKKCNDGGCVCEDYIMNRCRARSCFLKFFWYSGHAKYLKGAGKWRQVLQALWTKSCLSDTYPGRCQCWGVSRGPNSEQIQDTIMIVKKPSGLAEVCWILWFLGIHFKDSRQVAVKTTLARINVNIGWVFCVQKN